MKHAQNSWAFRDGVHRDLRAALKSHHTDTVSVLRAMIAAIDNAEAIPPKAGSPRSADGPFAHSSPGVGSTEAPRRELAISDVHVIVGNLLREYETQEEQYRLMHQHEAADRLRRQAGVLRSYLHA